MSEDPVKMKVKDKIAESGVGRGLEIKRSWFDSFHDRYFDYVIRDWK